MRAVSFAGAERVLEIYARHVNGDDNNLDTCDILLGYVSRSKRHNQGKDRRSGCAMAVQWLLGGEEEGSAEIIKKKTQRR